TENNTARQQPPAPQATPQDPPVIVVAPLFVPAPPDAANAEKTPDAPASPVLTPLPTEDTAQHEEKLPEIQPLAPGALPPTPSGAREKSVKKGVNFWSPEQEQQMGKQIDGQMRSQVQLLDDPVVTGYIEDVTARIARSSDVEVPVILRVVSSSQPDSFSLPGGYIYITVGMVRETRSEAELAAILSHEVAHIACRHATRQMTKRQLVGLLAIPLMFVSGPIGFAVGEGFSLAYPLTMLK